MSVSEISIPPGLALILDRAGNRSGVDFDYLLTTAMRESRLDPTARAESSSATGLFQFLEQTWFEVMKSDGARLGYARYAEAITRKADGTLDISDNTLRAEVLKLREDPEIAANLAAAFTRNNGAYLEKAFGRMPSPGELYIAHFLGARGAEKLFRAGLSDPDQIAANLFPGQAEVNRAIFYENGTPRTIRELYRVLVAKHGDGAGSAVSGGASAGASASPLTMSFTELYSSTGRAPASPLASEPVVHAGFFAQLYSN
ncbi:MAG: hypothetical protein KKH72_13345 [Alphaproteobacteria bacterium]|nr:hypothetical protein [Alphaproteobacteria bacterium]